MSSHISLGLSDFFLKFYFIKKIFKHIEKLKGFL